MKTFVLATGLALTSLAMPQTGIAQELHAAVEIVVSAEHQRDWDRGSKIEAEGLRDMQKAKRDLVKYSADVVNAQDLRDTSLSRAENARQAFESLTSRPFFSDPSNAREWARQVEATASDWEEYSDRSEKGAKDLRKAQKRQTNAQTKVDEAQAKIDEGRALKAEAERASRRQANS